MWVCSLDKIFLIVQRGCLVSSSRRVLGILNFKHFKVLLSSSIVVLTGGPIIIKFGSDLPVSFLNVSLNDKWMLKELRPSQPFIWSLVEKALKE